MRRRGPPPPPRAPARPRQESMRHVLRFASGHAAAVRTLRSRRCSPPGRKESDCDAASYVQESHRWALRLWWAAWRLWCFLALCLRFLWCLCFFGLWCFLWWRLTQRTLPWRRTLRWPLRQRCLGAQVAGPGCPGRRRRRCRRRAGRGRLVAGPSHSPASSVAGRDRGGREVDAAADAGVIEARVGVERVGGVGGRGVEEEVAAGGADPVTVGGEVGHPVGEAVADEQPAAVAQLIDVAAGVGIAGGGGVLVGGDQRGVGGEGEGAVVGERGQGRRRRRRRRRRRDGVEAGRSRRRGRRRR